VLSQSFIQRYEKLERERDAGTGIWTQCQMSAEIVFPRGENIDPKYLNRNENGDTKTLAAHIGKGVDTIERRACAWREWERFQNVQLYDENGEELDLTHRQVRDRLYYSHFRAMGEKVEAGLIDSETAAFFLVDAVMNSRSVAGMVNTLNVTMEVEEYFHQIAWPKYRRKTQKMLEYPQVIGEVRKAMTTIVDSEP
jgi:hypothetical protein